MKLRHVAARDANQQFSSLLAAAERDRETIVITRRGKPVARLVPEPEPTEKDITDWLEGLAWPMGGGSFVRDELYDRGDPRP